MQLVPGVGGGPGVGVHGSAHSAIVANIAIQLAVVEAGDEVKQPPELVLGHPEATEDLEDTRA